MSEKSLEGRLQKITERFRAIERPPATTLDILDEPTRERHWEALLAYFLDPRNPHGFGTDVLATFLDALSGHEQTTLHEGLRDLDRVDVQTQVPTGSGPFDLLLWCDDQWYVCLELKVDATETGAQTVRYAQASELDDLRVSEHDGVGEYVYLAPSSACASTSEIFVDVAWEHVVPYLEEILRNSHGQYPSKSRAQLADYLDTIRRTLNMDDFTTISEETRLYVEHADTIDRLVESYEDDREKIFKRLEAEFFDRSAERRDDWTVNNSPKTYVSFARPYWSGVGPGVTIEYEPHVYLERDTPDIRLRLDIEKGEKGLLREELHEKLEPKELAGLEDDGWEIVDGSYAYLAKSVPLNLESPDESIRRAIEDLHALRDIVEPRIEEIVAEHEES